MSTSCSALSTLPVSERPRERCLERGAAALSLRECLALTLGSGPRNRGCLGVAAEVLARPGIGLRPSDEERAFFTAMETGAEALLSGIHGLGPAGRARLLATFELARRYAAYRSKPIASEGQNIYVPTLAAQALARVEQKLRASPQEWLGFVAIHRSGELSEFCLVEKGARTHVNTDPAEIFARLLALRPKAFFLFHNHPSGDTTPSESDRNLTRHMNRLAQEFGIRLLGHWIVACQDEFWLI